MPRRINISTTPEMRARIVDHIQGQPGISSITLHPGASVGSDDDVLAIDATNDAALTIIRFLDKAEALEAGSVTISEPSAAIAAGQARPLDEEGNEAIWEEIGSLMRRQANLSTNFLLLMTLSGVIAAFGLVTDTLHIIIGAMLVAPGYEPLLRIAFGLLGHRYSIKAGLQSTCAGYLLLAFGALVGTALGLFLHTNTAADVTGLQWVNYWSKVEATGVTISLFAGIAGAVVVASRLSVLATGVMVALALVPSMALVGVGLGSGNLGLASSALARWGVDALCVLTGGGITLAVKQQLSHRRRRTRAV